MDVFQINQSVQDLLDATTGSSDAYAFESAWAAVEDYCKDHDLLDVSAGLLAESLFRSDCNVLAALRQSHQRQGKQKAAYDSRKKIWVFLVDLMARLQPQQLALYATDVIQAASHHARVEENAHVRNAALDALTYILTQISQGALPISVLPDSPTALAAPLQRLYLSSEARDRSTLKASLLGVLGLLLQLIDRYTSAGRVPAAAATSQQGNQASTRAAGAVTSGVEVLNRHWLLQMCRGELADGLGLSSSKANEGTIEGMTAALRLMQPGEADADLSAMLGLSCTLLHELAQALTYKQKYEKYGRYKAATACLQQLGQHMSAALLLTGPAPAAVSTGPTRAVGGPAAAAAAAAAEGVRSIGAVLLHDLMVICAGSPNKDMRNAAEEAMATVAGLINIELLASRNSSVGTSVLQQVIRICNQEFAGVGGTAVAAAARRAAQGDGAGATGAAGSPGSEPVRETSPEAVTSSGWMRGAVEVLARLVPAVAAYQGVKVVCKAVTGPRPVAVPVPSNAPCCLLDKLLHAPCLPACSAWLCMDTGWCLAGQACLPHCATGAS